MPIEKASPLNINNFSFYAFNPKIPALSERDKKIVILAHILLSCTVGLGHTICGIVYACKHSEFVQELLQFVSKVDSVNRLALAGLKLKDIEFLDVNGKLPNDPSQYGCGINFGDSRIYGISLKEEELEQVSKKVKTSWFYGSNIKGLEEFSEINNKEERNKKILESLKNKADQIIDPKERKEEFERIDWFTTLAAHGISLGF